MSRSLQMSIYVSLMVVYFSGTGVVPKGKHRHRKSSFPTITVHVVIICVFALTPWYAASRYVFPIKMRYELHFMHMTAIMWSILRSHKP